MTTTRRTLLRAAAGLAVASPAILRAQPAWPAKPITIVVNFPAGGLTDGIARSFGQSVQQATGQQVIIDNKPGASGNIGARGACGAGVCAPDVRPTEAGRQGREYGGGGRGRRRHWGLDGAAQGPPVVVA